MAHHSQLADWGEWIYAVLPWVLIFFVAWFFIFRQMRALASQQLPTDPRRRRTLLDASNVSRPLNLKLLAGGQHDGLDYMVRYWPGDKSNPPTLNITLMRPSRFSFALRRRPEPATQQEGIVHLPLLTRLLTRLYFIPVATGHAEFDAEYEMTSGRHSRPMVVALFREEPRRQAARQLTAAGITNVLHDSEGTDAFIMNYEGSATVDPSFVHQVLDLLKTLTQPSPQADLVCSPLPTAAMRLRYWLAVAISISCLLSTFALAFLYDRKWQPGRESNVQFGVVVAISLLTALVMLLILIRLFRSARTAPAPADWSPARAALLDYGRNSIIPFFACVIGFLFTMANTIILIQLLNMKLDRHLPATHLQRIVGMNYENRDWNVLVVPWYESKEAKSLRVSGRDLERLLEIGEDDLIDADLYMRIVTHPGFFGMEWVESAHPAWTSRPAD